MPLRRCSLSKAASNGAPGDVPRRGCRGTQRARAASSLQRTPPPGLKGAAPASAPRRATRRWTSCLRRAAAAGEAPAAVRGSVGVRGLQRHVRVCAQQHRCGSCRRARTHTRAGLEWRRRRKRERRRGISCLRLNATSARTGKLFAIPLPLVAPPPRAQSPPRELDSVSPLSSGLTATPSRAARNTPACSVSRARAMQLALLAGCAPAAGAAHAHRRVTAAARAPARARCLPRSHSLRGFAGVSLPSRAVPCRRRTLLAPAAAASVQHSSSNDGSFARCVRPGCEARRRERRCAHALAVRCRDDAGARSRSSRSCLASFRCWCGQPTRFFTRTR